MNLELDHVFILVEPAAQVADRLLEQGFREGPRNTHPGQGTANRRFYFISTPSTDTEGVLELASQADRLSMRSRQDHLMEITLDHHDSGRTEDYRPALPLILRW
ncbi:VOC family protein [Nodosilinea sp. LEGE 07088]|uniref:VOC family protein n=1 Tax=Nodosilinea sp. LEGE 07088 TaxID=2777968 RepID=UPI0018800F3B|nr:VOC family protein [Nodosilinea sp. LEGE 07088]MBE9137293.1 VOC family protein [Nodosilinea sp. LEGE 07088]